MYGVDGGDMVVRSLVCVIVVEMLMLKRRQSQVALHPGASGHAVLVHIDDLNGSSRRVVVLLVVLFAHLVEDDQHDGRHERDGHEAADDDLGGLHDLIQAVQGALPELRDRDRVRLLRGTRGERHARRGGGCRRERDGLPRTGGGGGAHLMLHRGGEALVVWRLNGLHRHCGEVAEAAVLRRGHVERCRSRRVTCRIADHARVGARVLHCNIGEVKRAVVQHRDSDLVRAVRHDGAVGCNPAYRRQGAGSALQLCSASLRHI